MEEEMAWRQTSQLYNAFCEEDNDSFLEPEYDNEADRADDAWKEEQ